VDELAQRDGVRAVLVRADGPAFSVGGDLHHFAGRLDELPAELKAMIRGFHLTLRRLAELPMPVVCAAHGAIAGGGLGLLWASDLVLLADDVTLTAAFARLGLSGDGGSSWYLPRLVGLRRALQLMLGGRSLSAAAALEWGLADRVVPAAELPQEAAEAVRALADGPTVALGEIRRLVRAAGERDLTAGLDAELAAIIRCGATADAREGIRSFLDRRPPAFSGR
jgi:2-(1,2-epoxy-1,2-dihydrophenyl)acetyl-CoA isomerase